MPLQTLLVRDKMNMLQEERNEKLLSGEGEMKTVEAPKILIADDDPDVLRVMEKRIKADGYRVVKAQDGLEAWAKICSELPDVIVLDLVMPGLDGFSVLEKLRNQPAVKKWQPVIIVSARGELEDMKKGFSLEADHYIMKPCQMEEVLKAITLMLNLLPQRKHPSELEP
ncbi:MAG TPA: response regulator [Candidatus Omnitrophota bacterium]|nr:response regulator [Candidatus Omnitrophota bacterium]HPN56104.1 response regulator [Candidatus Omnitrophota bacterium]